MADPFRPEFRAFELPVLKAHTMARYLIETGKLPEAEVYIFAVFFGDKYKVHNPDQKLGLVKSPYCKLSEEDEEAARVEFEYLYSKQDADAMKLFLNVFVSNLLP